MDYSTEGATLQVSTKNSITSITLSFADNIGEILTAGPIEKDEAPLSFKFYI